VSAAHWFPGIVGLFGIVMINCFNYSAYATQGAQAMSCNNAWLFISFLIMFGTIIAAVWVLVDYFANTNDMWPGIALVIQTVCQLLSAVVFFIGRENGGGAPQTGMF
jgi:hypothetical protein